MGSKACIISIVVYSHTVYLQPVLSFYKMGCYEIFRYLVCPRFFIWYTIYSISFIEGLGLFFFSFGVWLSKRNFPIHKKPDWFSYYLSWLFYNGISVIKTFMAFEPEADNPAAPYILYTLHGISIFSGIPAIWFGADPIVKWCMSKNWFVWASAFSFIIFALHVPLIHYATRLAFIYWHDILNTGY